jgi:hypothetical protein
VIRDQQGLVGAVDHRLEQWVRHVLAADAQNAGGEREQQENADRRHQRQETQHIGFGMAAADQHQSCGSAHQDNSNREHEADAAAVLTCAGAIERRAHDISGHILLRHNRPVFRFRSSSRPELQIGNTNVLFLVPESQCLSR